MYILRLRNFVTRGFPSRYANMQIDIVNMQEAGTHRRFVGVV